MNGQKIFKKTNKNGNVRWYINDKKQNERNGKNNVYSLCGVLRENIRFHCVVSRTGWTVNVVLPEGREQRLCS